MIDWNRAQNRLGVMADNDPGVRTYDALCAYVAGRTVEQVDDRIARGLAIFAPAFEQDKTPERLAEFIAQCCNETGGWRAWQENLNYSAAGMLRTWPSRFTPAQAQAAVGHPNEVASRAYGGRMGNAAYPSPDGYTYRGRGALQLTGKAAYKRFGDLLGIDLIAKPDMAADPNISIRIALEFFKLNGVNDPIDRGNYREARRRTNGGAIGLENVASLRARALKVLA